jgi:hypothetical protein
MEAIKQFNINIGRASELLEIHKKNYPKGRPESKGPPSDLLRAVIVFAVAALDAYIGKRIIEVVGKNIINNQKVSDKCLDYIFDANNKPKDVGRILVNIAINKKPDKVILNRIAKSIKQKTFQKTEELDEAFKIMGIEKDAWSKINNLIHSKRGRRQRGRRRSAENIINNLAKRRNAIVHESDMYLNNKHHGKIRPISRKPVEKDIELLKRIVNAIEDVSGI